MNNCKNCIKSSIIENCHEETIKIHNLCEILVCLTSYDFLHDVNLSTIAELLEEKSRIVRDNLGDLE